ncbi:ATP-binding protein [Streptomyces sp. NPDC002886]|uniref:ATP-binding protein n=1 Tax=Streptomyces sp. NPDC002886 TaxID=3364667 RepID=UPI0036B04202
MNPTSADTAEGSTRRRSSSATAATAPRSAAEAREEVGALLQHAGIALDSVTAADALLVTSELVTNAIRHGGGLTAFRTEITGEALRVDVSDTSPHTPTARAAAPEQPGGFGWPLIQRLAAHVDIHSHSRGKTITTVLRLT